MTPVVAWSPADYYRASRAARAAWDASQPQFVLFDAELTAGAVDAFVDQATPPSAVSFVLASGAEPHSSVAHRALGSRPYSSPGNGDASAPTNPAEEVAASDAPATEGALPPISESAAFAGTSTTTEADASLLGSRARLQGGL